MKRVLSYDIGGTGIKAAVVDPEGKFLEEKIRIDTPPIKSPAGFIKLLEGMAKQFRRYDAIAVGFPGLVIGGKIRSCPTLKTDCLLGVSLAEVMAKHFGVGVRIFNDAEMQAFPVISGRGMEVLVTLGTGVGFALFQDGQVGSHLELSTHPFRKDQTYNERLGNEALQKRGFKKWRREVELAITTLQQFTQYDRLYLGGGNAQHLVGQVPPGVKIVSNDQGIAGGAWAWRERELRGMA